MAPSDHKTPRLVTWLIALSLAACTPPMSRQASFRARPDSPSTGRLAGPFSGQVLDKQTQRPITGALVYANWSFVAGFGLNAPSATREYLGSTDKNGHYTIPKLADRPLKSRLAGFSLVIYKKGYVAYRSDRRFSDFGARTDFTQSNNVVRMKRWRSDYSHTRHLRYVGGGPTLAALTEWEHQDAAAELSGRGARRRRKQRSKLDAMALLTVDDVRHVTSYEGDFIVSRLPDQPRSNSYDSVHFKAKGQPESHDIAMRLWVIGPRAAKQMYTQLKGELPNAKERTEMGSLSLRATSENRDIYGVSYYDETKGVVVLLTCGVSQCTSADAAVDLMRLVKAQVDLWHAGESL